MLRPLLLYRRLDGRMEVNSYHSSFLQGSPGAKCEVVNIPFTPPTMNMVAIIRMFLRYIIEKRQQKVVAIRILSGSFTKYAS
jgi:hypothetical protein